MVESTRKMDQVSEKEIGEFLNRFFYRKLFHRYETIVDTNRQLQGVDVIADGLKIDNKAMSDPKYINNPKNTFILELWVHSEKRQCDYLGWFLNPDLDTTHYLFVWIPDANVRRGEYITSCRQINKLEVMLLDREKLHEYIFSKYSDEELLKICQDMVVGNIERTDMWKFASNNYMRYPPCVRFSNHLQEKPCNLVMPKSELKKCAVKHCFVTAKEISDIT